MTDNKVKFDITQIASTLWSHRKLFIKVWVITFVLSCIWILPQPRYYTCEVSVSPESSSGGAGGGLSSLVSSFGIDMGSMGSNDAIYPMLYPDVFESTEFTVGLFDIIVETSEDSIRTDYYTYLTKHRKENMLLYPYNWTKRKIKHFFKPPMPPIPGKDGKRFDPFHLTYEMTELIKGVQSDITCTYSKTTDVITISVRDQDPLACAILADSVKAHLQDYIVDYRTKKVRNDLEHYQQMTREAYAEYERIAAEYAAYSDSHFNSILSQDNVKVSTLENEMQTAYNIYTQYRTQEQLYASKVQENTPVFVTLKNATVPVKPAGPKRMIFVAAMLFLATLGTGYWLFRKELKEWF